MRFPDAEALAITFLTSKVGVVPVASKVPATRPAKFVRVWRTGGASMNRILDRPILTVQAWAADTATASALAQDCREAFFDDYTQMPLVRGVEEVSGVYFDPDPSTGTDRYTFSVQLQVRAHRT